MSGRSGSVEMTNMGSAEAPDNNLLTNDELRQSVSFEEEEAPAPDMMRDDDVLKSRLTPTGKWELLSWYAYDWANSVYSTVAITAFFPLLIKELASDKANCPQKDDGSWNCGDDDYVYLLWFIPVKPSSVPLLFLSLSVLAQVVTFLTISAMADYGKMRKFMLLIFAFIGSISTMLSIFMWHEETWWLVGILVIISNTAYGASFIFYNAYLPLLTAAHPSVLTLAASLYLDPTIAGVRGGSVAAINFEQVLDDAREEEMEAVEEAERELHLAQLDEESRRASIISAGNISVAASSRLGSGSVISPEEEAKEDPNADLNFLLSKHESVGNSISTKGFAAGYASGVLLLIVCAPLTIVIDDMNTVARVSCFLAGLWWLVFTIIPMIFLRPRAGPKLPKGRTYIGHSLRTVWATFLKINQLPQLGTFLLSWFLYSDGFSTLSSVGILFAQDELNFTAMDTFIIALEVPLAALLGAFVFLALHKHCKVASRWIILCNLLVFMALALYGVIGSIRGLPFGLVTKFEMYFFGVIFGFQLGSIQSFSRVVFAELVPAGYESEFFGFFEITDKGSSWMGPLVVFLISNATNQMRFGLLYCVFIMFVSIPLLLMVNIKKGKEQAARFASKDH